MPLHYGWLPVGNEEIRYLEGGEGAPIVFLHGAIGSMEIWKPVQEILSKQFFVFAFDLPGFGSSKKNNVSYTIPYFADFLYSLLERRKFSRPSIVGASMGARIALEFAVKYPTELDRLILWAPSGVSAGPWNLRGILSLFVIRELWLKWYLRPAQIKKIWKKELPLNHSSFKQIWESNPSYHDDNERSLWIRAFSRSVRSLMTYPLGNRAVNISRPTLVLSGTGDIHHSIEEAKLLQSKIPQARFEVCQGAGHFLMLERPEEFATIVANFIQQAVRT